MHVAGAIFECLDQKLIHELDKRCVFGHLQQVVGVILFFADHLNAAAVVARGQHAVHGFGPDAVGLPDRLLDLAHAGQHGLSSAVQKQGEFVQDFQVKRIRDRDRDQISVTADRQNRVLNQEPDRQLAAKFGQRREFIGSRPHQSGLAAQGIHEVAFADQAQANQTAIQSLAVFGQALRHPAQRLFRNHALSGQEFRNHVRTFKQEPAYADSLSLCLRGRGYRSARLHRRHGHQTPAP